MAASSRRTSNSGAKSRKNKRGLKATEKAAMTAGSLSAITFAPAAANAAVVSVTGSPVSLAMTVPIGTTVRWDTTNA